jgi:hypothetical protein
MWWLDNVALFAVSADHVDPEAAFPIFVNDTDQPRTFSLGEKCYLDLDSNVITQSIVLPPFSSRILIALDSCSTTAIRGSVLPGKPGLDVYPNPSRDGRISLDVTGAAGADAVVLLFDVLGRKVWASPSFSRTASFHVHGLHSGRYFVLLCSSGERIARMLTVLE